MENIDSKTDRELVELAIKDDRYFEYIIERYEAKLSRYIFRVYSLSREAIEDILQEVFIKLYQNLNDFDAQYSFSGWIYRITHNTLVSYLRKNEHKNSPISIDDDSTKKLLDFLPDKTDLVKEFEIKESAEVVAKALKEIPEKYREVLFLYYFESKSYKEIGDILRCSVNSVSVLMNRAKQKLKESIKIFNS